MATEPTKLPEWASSNPVDPVSGMNAITEPSEAKKDSGFLRAERPPRQDFNWLFNLLYLWIEWFQQQVNYLFNNVSTILTNNDITPDTGESDQLESALGKNFLPVYYCGGFSNWASAGLPTPQISIAGGCCVDRYSDIMINTKNDPAWPVGGASLRKSVAVAWARGDNVGGMTPGVSLPLATAWYYIFAICVDYRNEVDIVFDNDIDGSNVIADLSPVAIRRIGSFYWIGNLANYRMAGKIFTFGDGAVQAHASPPIVDQTPILLQVNTPLMDSMLGTFLIRVKWASPLTTNNHLISVSDDGSFSGSIAQCIAHIGDTDAYMEVQVRPIINGGVPKIAIGIARENALTTPPTAPTNIDIYTRAFHDPIEYELSNPW